MTGCFVTGTDTGVGKTVLAAAVAAALGRRGVRVRALKPVLSGLNDPAPAGWPHDHELLAAATGATAETVALRRFGPPVSPHLAAELAGEPLDVERLLAEILEVVRVSEFTVVEGVGGLLVPLGEGWDVRRLAVELGLPILIAARPSLGTINHTLLTLEAARSAGLDVRAVVLTPWPAAPGVIERSNREAIAALGAVEVGMLPLLPQADPELLAQAGMRLPLERWLSPGVL